MNKEKIGRTTLGSALQKLKLTKFLFIILFEFIYVIIAFGLSLSANKIIEIDQTIVRLETTNEYVWYVLEDGNVNIHDTTGTLLKTIPMMAKPKDLIEVMPDLDMAAIMRDKIINNESLLEKITSIFKDQGSVELWDLSADSSIFSYKVDGFAYKIDIDKNNNLIAFLVCRESERLLYVANYKQQRIIKKLELPGLFIDMAFENNQLILLFQRAISIYDVDSNNIIRNKTELHGIGIHNPLVFTYRSGNQKKIIILSEDRNADFGPISFIKCPNIVVQYLKLSDEYDYQDVRFELHYPSRKLFINIEETKLTIGDIIKDSSTQYDIPTLTGLGESAFVTPFALNKCFLFTFDELQNKRSIYIYNFEQ